MRDMKPGLVLLVSALSLAPRAYGAELEHHSTTLHFHVEHEKAFLPSGLISRIEKIHSRLRLNLRGVAPWMDQEKIGLMLYSSRDGYLSSPVNPPPWSDGVAVYKRRGTQILDRSVATYDHEGYEKTLAHEMTHMLLGTFFSEGTAKPPRWLDEGLAVSMEEETAPGKPREIMPLAELMATAPGNDDPAQRVGQWYAQSASVVWFLLKAQNPLAFSKLCRRLRDGDSFDRALAQSYPYPKVSDLEAAWLQWLKKPEKKALPRMN